VIPRKIPARPRRDKKRAGGNPRLEADETTKSAKNVIWLPFLDTYRTMCLAPQPHFRRVLEEVREMRLAA
jgi:hypothetical protein